jgi:hypothetical protein
MRKIILSLVIAVLFLSSNLLAADYNALSVAGTPVQIYAAGYTPRAIGVVMCSAVTSTVTIFFGSDSSVSSTIYGFSLTPGGCLILNGHLNSWWAVTAGTTATVSYQILY